MSAGPALARALALAPAASGPGRQGCHTVARHWLGGASYCYVRRIATPGAGCPRRRPLTSISLAWSSRERAGERVLVEHSVELDLQDLRAAARGLRDQRFLEATSCHQLPTLDAWAVCYSICESKSSDSTESSGNLRWRPCFARELGFASSSVALSR